MAENKTQNLNIEKKGFDDKEERCIETYEVRKELRFRKREVELEQRYLKGEELLNMQDYINKHIYLYRNFEPTFEAKAGEIYFADFPVGFGNEIHGRHPVIVLNNSGAKQQIMTVIPLTSKSCNKVSDVDLGIIKGLSKNGQHSIAVINQTRSIDKRRLVIEQVIDVLQSRENENPSKPGQEIRLDSIKICRLPEDIMTIIRNKVKRFVGYNKITNKKL